MLLIVEISLGTCFFLVFFVGGKWSCLAHLAVALVGRRRGCGGGGGRVGRRRILISAAFRFPLFFSSFFFKVGHSEKKRRGREMRRKERGKKEELPSGFPQKNKRREEGGKLSFPTLSKLTHWGIEKSFKIEIEFFRILGGKTPSYYCSPNPEYLYHAILCSF